LRQERSGGSSWSGIVVVAGTDVRRRREEFSRSAADGNTVWVGRWKNVKKVVLRGQSEGAMTGGDDRMSVAWDDTAVGEDENGVFIGRVRSESGLALF
jgi:hypothetical protein